MNKSQKKLGVLGGREESRYNHFQNLAVIDKLTADYPARAKRARAEVEMVRPEWVVTKGHIDRSYLSPVDGRWHLEDSDMSRIQNGRHQQDPASHTNWGCDMYQVLRYTPTGVTFTTYSPTSPALDRVEWHAVDRAIKAAEKNARLIAASDLPKRTVKEICLAGNTWALAARQCKWGEEWVTYECDGFFTK